MTDSIKTYQRSVDRGAVTVAHFMSKVYLWMMLGLAISAGMAYYVYSTPALFQIVFRTPGVFMGLVIAQLAAVIAFTWLNQRLSAMGATLLYLFYTVLTGVTLSVILFAYTQQNIYDAFGVTSAAFFGLSLFGYVTKKDLGPIGTFCMMGLFGMIAVMFLGIFIPGLHSSNAQLVISAIGVLVFSGLTAYDTQRIKLAYLDSNGAQAKKAAVNGALHLYLDFINLFLSLLRLFGGRR